MLPVFEVVIASLPCISWLGFFLTVLTTGELAAEKRRDWRLKKILTAVCAGIWSKLGLEREYNWFLGSFSYA